MLLRFSPLFFLFAVGQIADAAGNPALTEGQTAEVSLVSPPGRTSISFAAAEGPRYLIVEQIDVDLRILLCSEDQSCRSYESPLDRYDRWPLLLPPGAGYVELEAAAGARPTGRVRLRLGTPPPGERRALHALALERAKEATSSAGSGQEGLELWRRTATAFENSGDVEGKAWALHAAAKKAQELRLAREAFPLFGTAREAWTEAGAPILAAYAEQGLASMQMRLGNTTAARKDLEEALAEFRRLEVPDGIAGALADLGLADHLEGRYDTALARYQQALEIYRARGDRLSEAVLLANQGGVLSQQGEAGQALDLYQEALEIYRALARRVEELELLNNLAVLYRQMGESEEALRIYENVVAKSRSAGNEAALGRALNNQGYAYFALGDFERAATYFEQALELRRRQGDRRGERVTLSNLGDVEFFRRRLTAAADYHRRALAILRELKQGGEATAASLLAQDLAELGDEESLALLADALSEAESTERPAIVEEIRLRQAEALLRFGHTEAARSAFARALAYFGGTARADGDKVDSAKASLAATGLGRAERALGHGDAALDSFRGAIRLLEKQRTAIENPTLRATFLSTRRLAYELFVLTAAEEAAKRKRPDLLLEALAMLEQSRARGLLDLLVEARPRGGESKRTEALGNERREVLRRMALLAREEELAAQGKRRGDPARLASMLEEARVKLDRIDSDLRRDDPRLAALAPAKPAPLATWRSAIDGRTRLLHFLLSDEGSLVFVVGREGLEARSLPPRREIDALARRAATGLASPTEADPALAELGQLLFSPILPALDGVERLWIVADGSLNYLPFAALEVAGSPSDEKRRLVERFEITNLPSGGVLAELLARPPHRKLEKIAVFADPVFAWSDAQARAAGRLAARSDEEQAREADPLRLPGTAGLSRLPGTRFEAERIAELAPQKVTVATGFDASRARLEKEAPRADVLHLATHGLIDTDHPELSGLALSLFSAEGRWQPEGLLRLDDFAALQLDAELVVLSGCRTALGRQIGGEGLLGLARGLFYAGSRRVLASLWPVRDRATAELMASFYRSLLAGNSPASSLRHAQLDVSRSDRFGDPFYWAPFVLIGDPR